MSEKSKKEKAKPILDKEIQEAARFPLMGSTNLDSNLNFGSLGSLSIRSIKISKEKINKDIFDIKIEEKGK